LVQAGSPFGSLVVVSGEDLGPFGCAQGDMTSL